MAEQKFSTIKYFFKYFLPMLIIVAIITSSHFYQALRYDKKAMIMRDKNILEQARQIPSTLFQQIISDLMILNSGETLKAYLHDESIKKWIYLAREFETFSRYKKKI